MKLKMLWLIPVLTACHFVLYGQDAVGRDPGYVKVIEDRTEKLMPSIGVTDSEARARVKARIMDHYFALNDIYEARDSLNKALATERQQGLSETEVKKRQECIAALTDSRLYRPHYGFLAGLMLDLTPEQIEAVKNGLTYNVLNVTYDAHLDMIPSLTEAQKKKIYVWLVEAREYAMDAESSGKKHEIFGRYKGRINNYLSQEGYNLTQERRAWQQRLENRRP